jgi:hypothetical protein
MESKLLELENKIIDLTNDMNRIKASKPELFTNCCKLCSKVETIMHGMDCPNNSKLFFYVCSECKKANDLHIERQCAKPYDLLYSQGLFLKRIKEN